jgi:3-hydroxyacyl-CoA dehydrogenase
MSDNTPIRRVAIIGTGVIGASWTALFLAKGLEVAATDPAPNAEASLKRFIDAAWPALERLGLAPGASRSKLTFTPDLAAAVRGAGLVQENGPERIDFKKRLYGELDELLPAEVKGLPIASGALCDRASVQSAPSRSTRGNRWRRQAIQGHH